MAIIRETQRQVRKMFSTAFWLFTLLFGFIAVLFTTTTGQRSHETTLTVPADGVWIAHADAPGGGYDGGSGDSDGGDSIDSSDSTSDSTGDFGCFVAGTLILMADGSSKKIADIVVGDEVMSFDAFGELVPHKVVQTFKHKNKSVLDLHGTLVTSVHRFLLPSGEYKAIGDIEENTPLIAADGSSISSWARKPVDGLFDVYNFTVENTHTYVAGGFRVHNIK